MTSKKRMPTIKGIIIPSHWDEDGNIKEVSLHTSDEKEYRVEYGGVGKELLTHIHHKVEASGKIRERIDGRLYISVHSYMPLEDPFREAVV
ncbi:MAG: hypothetical protein WBM69_13545 [Desulfobacterales bacterium]